MNTDPRAVADVNVRPEIIGMEALLTPFPQFISSQRADMFSSNISQALVTDGCEMPRIGSGYEQMVGDYSFDTTKRTSQGQLYDVIPKFEVGYGAGGVLDSPHKTVVIATDDGLDCIEISNYTDLYNGFGYRNVLTTNALFLNKEAGTYIPQDMVFSHPPNHKQGAYCMGVNANTAYMTCMQATEDALVISESLAKRCEHTAIYTAKVFIEEDHAPVNLYGTETDPKIFPDIGEMVNEDGILMSVRPKNEAVFADLIEFALNRPQFTTDTNIVKVPAGSTVIDVQVFSSTKAMRKLSNNPGIMAQLVKYQNQHYTYYSKVIACYQRAKKEGLKIAPRFNDLVTRCMCLRRQGSAEKKIVLVDKRTPIKYFVVEITYSYTRKVSRGFKFAGRAGDKGVVSDIWPDSHMPVDEQGIRADIIISPESVANRLNPSQLYEQFINRMCVLVTDRYRRGELGDDNASFEYIMQFVTDIREEYGRQLREYHQHPSRRIELLDDIRADGLYLIIVPFCKDITIERMQQLAIKYEYIESPVTYTYKLPDGTDTTITTVHPVSIGSKYLYLLCKIPQMQTASMEVSYVNQFGLPSKTKSKFVKMQHLYSPTPLRFGEDEISILVMGLQPEQVVRLLGPRVNCIQSTEWLIEKLLTAKNPSAIGSLPMTTDYMVSNSVPAKLFNHFMGVVGFDTSKTSTGRKP
jgi:hypothetical protein